MAIKYDKKIQVGKYEIQISEDNTYGYFEHDDYGEDAGGSLTFENKVLEDFDGMMVLPLEVADGISKLGFNVNREYFCE
jgi:hypothetical protein